MNPKMFALLLLIPVAVFATDKLTSAPSDGGGKEKRKTESPATETKVDEVLEVQTAEPQETQATEPIQSRQAAEEVKNSAPTEANVKAKTPNAAAVAAIERLIASIRGSREYDETGYENRQYVYENEENADWQNWLVKNVKTPLENANPMSLNLAERFSRCPSGYHVFVVTKDDQPTNEGWIAEDSGCWDRPITKFRYDFAAKTVEADAGELGFMPLNDFIKLLKAAKV